MWKEQIIEIQLFSEDCFKLCSYENSQTGVKGGLNHKKIKDVSILNKRNYYLQKKRMSNTWILIKSCWFQEEYEEAYFLHHDIISDTLLVIGYFDILRKPCSCSGCLRNLANKQQKGENKTMFIGLL